jgi:hypothetical protein
MLRLFLIAPLAMAAVNECSRWYYAESSKAEIGVEQVPEPPVIID